MKKNYSINPSKWGALALMLLMTGGMVACSGNKKETAKDQTEEVKSVKVVSVHRDSLNIVERFTANVEAYVKNNITPQQPNRINRILVEVGQTVGKGQLLATLDNTQLSQQSLQMQNTEADFKRIEELYKVGGISKSQYEAQKMALSVAQTAHRNLSENTRLVSPISGVVTARNYDNGDMYNPAMPLLVVEQISPLKITVNMSEKYFTKVKKGMPVEISTDLYPGDVFPGEVALVAPTITPQSRTFTVEIHMRNQDKRLRPGMYATAEIHLGTEDALLVSDRAVATLSGTANKYVYLYQNGTAVRKNIEVDRIEGENYVVTSGLSEGDQVISSSLSTLRDGQKVQLAQ